MMLWIFPMSTLLIIICPKYLYYRRVEYRGDESNSCKIKRGERVGVHISGVNVSAKSASNHQRGLMVSELTQPRTLQNEPVEIVEADKSTDE